MFLSAQAPVWADVQRELRQGRKTTHWIWWVFPQLASLGRSERARRYGLAGLEDARDYLADPTLRTRLVEVARLLLTHRGTDPVEILGPVDALKVRSSMTLFSAIPDAPEEFAQVLDAFYDDERCPATVAAITGETR